MLQSVRNACRLRQGNGFGIRYRDASPSYISDACLRRGPCQKTLAAALVSADMLRQLIDLGPSLAIYEPSSKGNLTLIRRSPFTLSQNA
jgi:hypothetical protein